MVIIISESTINKLKHKIQEIRLRALREITEKLEDGLDYHTEIVNFNCRLLYEHLVDCLKLKLLPEREILHAFLLFLKEKSVSDLLKFYGVKKIRRDIQAGCSSDPRAISKVSEILATLSQYEAQEEVQPAKEDVITFPLLNLPQADYIQCWSSPHPVDLVEMKRIKEVFVHHEDMPNLENALKFTQAAIQNLPADQFLQPPYLYKSLLHCLNQKVLESEVLSTLSGLTRALHARIQERLMGYTTSDHENVHETDESQLSVPYYSYSLFLGLMTNLKEISDHSCQEKLNQNFTVMFEVIKLLELHNIPDENRSILRELTFFAKFYRENYEEDLKNYQMRTNYLTILRMIVAIGLYTSQEETEVECYGEKIKPIWIVELELNLMDFTLRESYPSLFEQIFHICKAQENNQLNCVINCASTLKVAVEILRNPIKWTSESLVLNGAEALNSIRITKSLGLVEKLVEAVVETASEMEGNLVLKDAGEKLILRLLSNGNKKIKCKAYASCKDHIKDFFTGQTNSIKSYVRGKNQLYFAGIPLNSEILTEIVCFGLKSEIPDVSKCSNAIVTFLVRGKPILGKYWAKFLEILLPVMPLLQSTVDMSSKLGYAVFELFDPDSELPALEIMLGNMRYLFSSDARIREEAIFRLIYIASKSAQAEFYLPNLDHIKDTITNNICVVAAPLPLRLGLKQGVFNVQTLMDLIKLLKDSEASPQIRHSTLVQISALMDDPDLCDALYRHNDWPYIFQAFDNSLKVFYHQDYPDSAVPALQIITKLCIHIAELRRNVSKDADFIFLLIRAMFLHHLDHDFKIDCATLIFTLIFADFVVGIDELSFPHALAGLHIPFQCEFHLTTSPFDEITLLESVFNTENEETIEEGYNDLIILIDDDDEMCKRIQSECGTMGGFRRHRRSSASKNVLKTEQWRFLRLTFAALWFDGIENVLLQVETSSEKLPNGVIDYLKTPFNEPQNMMNDNVLDFNANLKLNDVDVNLMKITAPTSTILYHIERIKNSNRHFLPTVGICGLMSALFLPQHFEVFPDKITQCIKRFVVASPVNETDEAIFIHVLRLIQKLINSGYETILCWMLLQLTNDSVFLKLLKCSAQPLELYKENCRLLKLIVQTAGKSSNPEVLKLLYENDSGDIALRIFEIIDNELKECDKDCIPSLVSLLQTLTLHLDIDTDDTHAMKVVKDLFTYVKVIKPIAQTGAYITKNCLLTIEHLLQIVKNPNIDKYLRQLSGLCSHGDKIIRAAAWNIFATYAQTLNGAKAIVEELSFLPGGIHASIIATICDESEKSVVKGAVTRLSSALLRYKTGKGALKTEVMPRSGKNKPKEEGKAYEVILEITRKQGLFEFIGFQLEHFCPNTQSLAEEGLDEACATPPGTVIYLCTICISIYDLRTDQKLSGSDIHSLQMFLNCISKISTHLSNATLSMTAEICKLFSRYLHAAPKLLQFIQSNPSILSTLLMLLDLRIYETVEICENTCVNVLQVIKLIAKLDAGYEMICYHLDEINFARTVEFFNIILTMYEHEDFIQAALDCLSVLLMKNSQVKNSTKFYEKLNSVNVRDYATDSNQLDQKEEYKICSGAETLIKRLIQLFNVICAKDKPKNGIIIESKLKHSLYNAMHAILKRTNSARIVAEENQLLSTIVDRLEAIHGSIGMSSSDYIRKFGDKKKQPIVDEIGNIINIIGAWYERATLTDETKIPRLVKILHVLWNWAKIFTSSETKFLFALVSLSEDSIVVCKSLSIIPHGVTIQFSLLKAVAGVASAECAKSNVNNVRIKVLQLSLRIMTNCCSCVEGRVLLMKLNVLDVISKFHPAITKNNDKLLKIAGSWLKFWEILSRYPEANEARHLSVLCALVRKSNPAIVLLSLQIMRNFSFNSSNRAALLSNEDFVYAVNLIFDNGSHEERLIVAVTIWKLIANSCKAKHEVKSSSIVKKLNLCLKQLVVYGKVDDELFNVLTIIDTVLNN